MGDILIQVRDLVKYFPISKGLIFSREKEILKAVDGVSFDIRIGQSLGLVGESGCGKTTVARLILLLESITRGGILYRGKNIESLKGEELRSYKKSVQAVFQDPYSSLNPRMRIKDIIAEPLLVQRSLTSDEIMERASQLLEFVGLDRSHASLFPHEFSGGQRQRIAIARALSINPSLLVLDEPVSALDVSIQAQILNLLKDIQGKSGCSFLFIGHDLAVVKHISNIIAVMYLGKIVEIGACDEIFSSPRHYYTRALISSVPIANPSFRNRGSILFGEVPSPIKVPPGCSFHPRCDHVWPQCTKEIPKLISVLPNHQVACHEYREYI